MHDGSDVQPTQTSATLGQGQSPKLGTPSKKRGHSVISIATALPEHARGQHVKLHSTLSLQRDNIEEINQPLWPTIGTKRHASSLRRRSWS